MSLATVAGVAALRAEVTIPGWGLWHADVELGEDPGIAEGASAPFTLGSVSGVAHVLASASDGGSRWGVRMVSGRGGWGTVLPAQGYRNDLGVSAASVALDVARKAGEVVAPAGAFASKRLGPNFARPAGPAYVTIAGLLGRDWYADFATGAVQTQARPTTTYTGEGELASNDPVARVLTLAVEDFAGLVPGAVVEGETLTDVRWTVEGKQASATGYYGPRVNRRVSAIAAILDALDPWRRFRASYDYRLISQTGQKCALQPVRTGSGLPQLDGVPVRWAPGYQATLTPGATVAVSFADGDPSRPYVSAGDYGDSPAADFLTLQLGGPLGLGVAYQGSAVTVDPITGIGTVTIGSTRVKVAP